MQAPLTFAVDNRLPEILDRMAALFPRKKRGSQLAPLDQLIFGIVAQGLSASGAMASYKRLRTAFPSPAALRDATPGAIQQQLIGVPASALKAGAIPEILRAVETAFGSLSLEELARWEGDQALRWLTRLPRVTEEIAASVLCFAGQERTVLSVDKDAARPLRRLALAEPGAPLSALPRQLIERAPVGWRCEEFSSFSQGLSRVADRFCHQGKPDCQHCPLASLCPAAEKRNDQATVVAFPFGKQRARA